jgi:hypothetical protein
MAPVADDVLQPAHQQLEEHYRIERRLPGVAVKLGGGFVEECQGQQLVQAPVQVVLGYPFREPERGVGLFQVQLCAPYTPLRTAPYSRSRVLQQPPIGGLFGQGEGSIKPAQIRKKGECAKIGLEPTRTRSERAGTDFEAAE